jgi:hypothetical protein
MKQVLLLVSCLVGCLVNSAQAQQIIPLYDGAVPNARATSKKEINENGMYRDVVTPYTRIYQTRKTQRDCGHRNCWGRLWRSCL